MAGARMPHRSMHCLMVSLGKPLPAKMSIRSIFVFSCFAFPSDLDDCRHLSACGEIETLFPRGDKQAFRSAFPWGAADGTDDASPALSIEGERSRGCYNFAISKAP